MTVRGKTLVSIANATPAVGAGHVMRQSVLAAAWKALGGTAVLAGDVSIDFVRQHLADLDIPIVERAPEAADLIVVDSYDALVRERGLESAVSVLVDDLGGSVPAGYDLVWNPNAYGEAALYPDFTGAVIGGPDAVPIRAGLPAWRPTSPEIVVTLGGGAPSGALQAALRHLAVIGSKQSFAIAGGWAPEGWRTIPPDRLWAVASSASRLVIGAGTTVWEAASVQVPVVVLQVADNQRLVYRWTREAAVPGVDARFADPEALAEQLVALLPAARPLPVLESGAGFVAKRLGGFLRSGATR